MGTIQEQRGEKASLECPNCNSKENWKDGNRRTNLGNTQRFICRLCGYRFSHNTTLNLNGLYNDSSQISAEKQTVKNLESVQKTNRFCVGDATRKKVDTETQLLLGQFSAYLKKEAYSAESDYVDKVKRLAVLGANLGDPEDVKTIISQMKNKKGEPAKNGTKMLCCYAYDAFAKMLKIPWDMPTYSQEDFEPFLPYETELDTLIAAATKSKLLTTFLQCLKEVFGDPAEVLRIRWLDVDYQNRRINIRYPCKNHMPRPLEVSSRLLAMIDALPKINERVFPVSYASILRSYVAVRKRAAEIHKNDRLLAIDFTAFRTWAITEICIQSNGNVLIAQKMAGHRQIKNTMKYISRNVDYKNQDYETTSAITVEDILKLGQAGWVEYSVVKAGAAEIHCFRKNKRFGIHI